MTWLAPLILPEKKQEPEKPGRGYVRRDMVKRLRQVREAMRRHRQRRAAA
jgi:hypothetical protein